MPAHQYPSNNREISLIIRWVQDRDVDAFHLSSSVAVNSRSLVLLLGGMLGGRRIVEVSGGIFVSGVLDRSVNSFNSYGSLFYLLDKIIYL